MISIRIQIFQKNVGIIKKEKNPVSRPFSFFLNEKMEHPHVEKETRKKQERGNHEPLVSLRRPGSAEQAQFFSVFGQTEASRKRQ